MVDSLLCREKDYSLICSSFGPVEKSTVIRDDEMRLRVNEFGRQTMDLILKEPTPEALLRFSREFAEKTGLASKNLLKLADKAMEFGAVGANQNMIGNAIHCLVPKRRRRDFIRDLSRIVPLYSIFESELIRSGPRFL